MGGAAATGRRRLPRPARLPARALALLPRQADRTAAGNQTLADIATLPLTEKRQATRDRHGGAPDWRRPARRPSASSACLPRRSGTTGTPSYIPLTASTSTMDHRSARSYAASGIEKGQRIVSTYRRRPVRGRGCARLFDRLWASRTSRRHRRHRPPAARHRAAKPDAAVLTRPTPPRYRRADAREFQRPARPRRRRARRRQAASRAALEEGSGSDGHRGHGHRRHWRLAVERVRAPGRDVQAFRRAASSTPSSSTPRRNSHPPRKRGAAGS